MSLQFVDGMSHFSTKAFLAKKWDVVSATGVAFDLTGGRFGRGRVIFTAPTGSFDQPDYIQKNYSGDSTVVIGMAVKQNATQNTYGGQWLEFLDGNRVQVGLAIMPSGQIQAFRSNVVGVILHPTEGAERTILGLSANSVSSSSYDFLEVKVIHAGGTSGSIEIKRNGQPFWLLENVNTAISGSNNSSSAVVGGYIAFGGASIAMGLQADVSSVYLLNATAGADPNDPVDFIGDRSWEPLFPLVDVLTEWTPDPAPDHFANVNSFNPPNEALNNNTEGVNDADTFEFEQAVGPTSASVIFSYTMLLEKNTGGAVGVSGRSTSNAADGNGTEFQVPNPYAFRQSFGFTDPDTTDPWTVAGFNAATHGYERTS